MIRIIHTLGGCGGTLLSRCLGVLPRVALFSEINQNSVKLYPHFDPLYQDRKWVGLLEATDVERLSQMNLAKTKGFRELLRVFHRRASAGGRELVIRDFAYVDFVGLPYTANPPRRLEICEALPEGIPVESIAFLRHPVDQWLSLCKHEQIGAVLRPSFFCGAYAAFLRELGSTPRYRYEDFIARPEVEFKAICRELALPFDGSFATRFHEFNSVTGDFERQGERSISAPTKRAVSREAMDDFESSEDYKTVLRMAGYFERILREN